MKSLGAGGAAGLASGAEVVEGGLTFASLMSQSGNRQPAAARPGEAMSQWAGPTSLSCKKDARRPEASRADADTTRERSGRSPHFVHLDQRQARRVVHAADD